MNNRNATASWSGFSFQGQVGLLVALIEMQNIDATKYDKYFLEYENREDVAIYMLKDNQTREYLSVHQVKAYYSDGHLINTYKDVFQGKEEFEVDEEGKIVLDSEKNKILLGYKETGWCSNDNYLHTATEITNWTQEKIDAIGNPFSVSRFKYSSDQNYCDINLIKKFILEEIEKIKGESTETKLAVILANLSLFLDEKVRFEHANKKTKVEYDVKISFQELQEIIQASDNVIHDENTYFSRKLFFEKYIECIKQLEIEEHIQNHANIIIQNIYNSNNLSFDNFISRLNLTKPKEYIHLPHLNYNDDGLKQVFFKILFSVKNCIPVMEDNFVKYRSKTSSVQHYVLTTIINEVEECSDILKTLIENVDNQNT